MAETTIEWTKGPNGEQGYTFNPWTGCTKVSPACDHCYAERWAKRTGGPLWGAGEERQRTSFGNWKKPTRWNAEAERLGIRYRVFCASLADVFDNAVPVEWRIDLFRLISATPYLDWLLLTKRISNAAPMMAEVSDRCGGGPMPLPNVWVGATICNQTEADRDIPKLLDVPAAKRFLSIEPLLEPVDIKKWLDPWTCADCCFHGDEDDCGPDGCSACGEHESFAGVDVCKSCGADDQSAKPSCPQCGSHRSFERDYGFKFDSEKKLIDWVIVGGESGHGARPMHPDWARSLRDQCQAAGIPFLFKQWGEFANADAAGLNLNTCYEAGRSGGWVESDATFTLGESASPKNINASHVFKVGKKAAGRMLDGREWNEIPNNDSELHFSNQAKEMDVSTAGNDVIGLVERESINYFNNPPTPSWRSALKSGG